MRARLFKHESTRPSEVSNTYIAEALAKQAASRPAKTPAKIMPVTPTLKKVPKLHRRRRAK